MAFENLAEALNRQKQFSDLFFNSEKITDREREEITKTFVLSLHSEASDLASAINFKDHRTKTHPIDSHKILYKSVDVFRYTLALLNLWNIDPQEFIDACEDKDLFLHSRYKENLVKRHSQPVIIFDIDDVIAEFRNCFNNWLHETHGVKPDPDSKEYYNTIGLMSEGLEPEAVFREFINTGGFRRIPVNKKIVSLMKKLSDMGYWIQLLTARPSDNLKCFYDTYNWLDAVGITYDALDFSGEKFRWLADQDFFNDGQLICAIDDSPKHAAEYAKHGVQVIVPDLPYNKEVHCQEGVHVLDFNKSEHEDFIDLIVQIQEK